MMQFALMALLALAGRLPAVEMNNANKVTGTVELAGLRIERANISVTVDPSRARILADIFPNQKERLALGDKFDPQALALALVQGPGKAKDPKLKAFRVDIVEYSQRDDYGLPVFSSMKPFYSVKGKVDRKGKVSFDKPAAK